MPAPPTEVADVLLGPHTPVVEASIDTGAQTVPVELVSGAVTVDRGRIWRREFSGELSPDTDLGLVQPRGHRLIIRRGVLAPDGRAFWAPLGVFRLTGYSRGPFGGVAVSGRSLEYEVARARFLSPRTVSGGSAVDEVKPLVAEVVAGASFAVDVTADAPVPAVVHEDDRWRAIDGSDQSMLRAIGAELFCDGDGTFRIADLPDLLDDPVWRVESGGALVGWREESGEDGVHNIVVATGERVDGDGPVPWGVWWDDNPASPTYVGDLAHDLLSGATTLDEVLVSGVTGARGFGASPRFYASPLLRSDGQAARAASTLGRQSVGVQRTVAFDAVLNPWLDAGDVVDVEVDERMERHLVERLSIPVTDLGAPIVAETRSQPT